MTAAIGAVLVDVGGTLWEDQPRTLMEGGDDQRIDRLLQAIPRLARPVAVELVHRFRLRTWELDGALIQDNAAFIHDTAERVGLPLDDDGVRAVGKAMSLPAPGRTRLFPGARELLGTIKELNLTCVVVSNSIWRLRDDYRIDFDELGVATYIDAIVSSADLGFRKPHRAIFEAALAFCGCEPGSCVMVGNSEAKDIEPALAMGMHAIRVAIEEPKPATSAAHAMVTTLSDAAAVLQTWVASGALQ